MHVFVRGLEVEAGLEILLADERVAARDDEHDDGGAENEELQDPQGLGVEAPRHGDERRCQQQVAEPDHDAGLAQGPGHERNRDEHQYGCRHDADVQLAGLVRQGREAERADDQERHAEDLQGPHVLEVGRGNPDVQGQEAEQQADVEIGVADASQQRGNGDEDLHGERDARHDLDAQPGVLAQLRLGVLGELRVAEIGCRPYLGQVGGNRQYPVPCIQ